MQSHKAISRERLYYDPQKGVLKLLGEFKDSTKSLLIYEQS